MSNKVEYNGEIIQYNITKSKIKNLYIQVKDGIVIVKAPKRLKDNIIEEFVNKKARWIYLKLKEQKAKKVENKEITEENINQLKEIIEYSINKYKKTIVITPNKVRIRDIKYAWGTCSSKKNITISLKLALKEDKVIEYVVLHEMCHLRYMNHSKEFWKLVEENMPKYKEYKKRLKE